MKHFSAGKYIKQRNYRAFIPSGINRNWILNDPLLSHRLSRADRALGRLDAFSDLVDIELFLLMHKTKEAVLSSKIEGTQTDIEEALMDVSAISSERRDDWTEVQNYIRAMDEALEVGNELPFSSRLIRMIHAPLMAGVRGQHKGPGEFRRSQNWIGGAGPDNAQFVPPPHTGIGALMSDLEKFANDPNNLLPPLLKIALIHYQFETIHPFQDGNGRTGRLLITLFLVKEEILQKPILYLSAFLERNRLDYYEKLTAVREHNDLRGWFLFFLEGVEQTAADGVQTFRRITRLQREIPERLRELGGRAGRALLLVRHLYRRPVMTIAQVSEVIEATYPTAHRLVQDLVKLDLLRPVNASGRGQHYVFWEYLSLFR